MNRSETIGALAAALAKAQGQMDAAKKASTNIQFHNSKYADLASIVDAIRKPLADNELSYAQVPEITPEGKILVETILMHSSGEWLAGTLAMQPTAIRQGGAVVAIPPGEMTPQVVGSVITYARRYGLQALVGIPADDDDGNAASGNGQQPLQQRQAPAPKQPGAKPVFIPPSESLPQPAPAIQRAPAPQEPANATPARASVEQVKAIYAIAEGRGMTVDEMQSECTAMFGVPAEEIATDQAAKLIRHLQKLT